MARIKIDHRGVEKGYFYHVSKKMRIAFYISVVATIIFIGGMFAAFSGEITGDNFRHLMRAMTISFSTPGSEGVIFYYDTDSRMSFTLFNNDFAVATTRGVTMFDRMGNTVFRDRRSFTNPQLASSNRWLLAYDRGGNSFAVYNNFGLLHQEIDRDFPVFLACVADNGTFAIATRTPSARSMIFIYNSNFQQLSDIPHSGHIIAMELTRDGRYLLMVYSTTNAQGQFLADVRVFDIEYSRQIVHQEYFLETMAFGAAWSENGGFTLMLSSGVLSFDSEFELVGQHSTDSESYTMFHVGSSTTALIYRATLVGNVNVVTLLDSESNVRSTREIVGRISLIQSSEDYVFIAVPDRIYRICIAGEVLYVDIERGVRGLVIVPGQNVLLCFAHRAYVVMFN